MGNTGSVPAPAVQVHESACRRGGAEIRVRAFKVAHTVSVHQPGSAASVLHSEAFDSTLQPFDYQLRRPALLLVAATVRLRTRASCSWRFRAILWQTNCLCFL
jgi:hypothetical protein